MNFIQKIIVLQFSLLTLKCQESQGLPNCHLQDDRHEERRDRYGNYYTKHLRTLNCYISEPFIFNGFFAHWQSDSNYETDKIFFHDSNFHTIQALTFYQLSDLKEIYLNESGVTILEMGCFLGLSKLEILQLDGNEIEELEKGMVSNLPNLTTLSLSDNKLRAIHKGSFEGLQTLRKLSLDGNNLYFLPEDLFSALNKIQTIDLSRNYLETLNSSTFDYLVELEYLYINSNKLKYLPSYLFKDLSNLILLDISNNSLTNLSSEVLTGLDRLTHLDISHNQLTTLKTKDLYFLSNLKELNLAYNNISFLNTDELTVFLPNLKEVYLHGNNWTCSMLLGIIKEFRMADVQVKPGKHYYEQNIIGIPCTGSSFDASFAYFRNDSGGLSTHETDERRFLQYNHILMEIAGKISDNNNLVEQLIHSSLNSSKSIQTIAESVQKNGINEESPITPHLSNQSMYDAAERTNILLGNILNELRDERSILQNLANYSRVNDDHQRQNAVNPQPLPPNESNSPSPPNPEIIKFLSSMKTELEISRTILDIFMKNMSQSIASIQAKINEPATPKNNNNQLIPERLQGNTTQSNTGNGNIAIIVCLFVLVVILIIILGITYFQYKKGSFIANGLRRYKSNRPPGNRSETDLITTSTTMSNSEV